ncbi:hypothetical protein [Streptomyces sp. NPDC086776]|uniref:hypothetical protein n=1 Tax=Streptomyces sp. NPDC086776 TaxID=3365756 RepID=UPI003830836F
MSDMILIQPTRDLRKPFAQWAVAQVPKVRTVGTNVFAVPAALFVEAPESVLVGSLVDGTRYVSPDEDAARQARLLDCGFCYEEAGEEVPPHPECPQGGAPGTGAEPLPEFTSLEDAPADEGESDPSDSGAEVPDKSGPFMCDVCGRDFTKARGRDTHRRQVHGTQGE